MIVLSKLFIVHTRYCNSVLTFVVSVIRKIKPYFYIHFRKQKEIFWLQISYLWLTIIVTTVIFEK